MLTGKPDFYLGSTDVYPDSDFARPRKCWRIKRLKGDVRDDYLLIRIDPPIIGQPFGLGGEDIHMVVVATKDRTASLFPIRRWPVYVFVIRLLVDEPESRDVVHDEELELVVWGELYGTEEDVRKAAT
ncbi:MAG TPA: hypothetical protein VF952_00120 [Chloroflexia bacterium]|jgi:hypothetical protein